MNFFQRTQARGKRGEPAEGFTLIEVLVTIAIYGLIMGAVAQVIVMIIQNSGEKLSALSSIDQVRFAGAQFSNEVRDAQPGNDGSYAISEASTTEIVLFTAYGASAPAIDRVRYYIASSTLYRGVVVPTGAPLLYNLAAEVVTPVVTNVENGTTSVFYYYDGTYAGTTSPLTQPINLTGITFVKMILPVLTDDARNATTTYTFTTGSAVRSLKMNLGN